MSRDEGPKAILIALLILTQVSAATGLESVASHQSQTASENRDIAVLSGLPTQLETSLETTSGLIWGPFGAFDPLENQIWRADDPSNGAGYGGLIIAQSETSDLRMMIDRIQDYGAVLQEFYPEDAAIFSLDETGQSMESILNLSEDENIRWVSRLPTSFRIDPILLEEPNAITDLDIHLIRDLDPGDLEEILINIKGFSIHQESDAWCEGRLCKAEAATPLVLMHLLQDNRVLYISKAANIETFDSISRSIIGLPPSMVAPPMDYDGSGEVISITDTGLDHDHESLADNIRAVYNQFGPDNSAADSNSGHGTHVTGIIVGNGTSDNQTLGIAPEAEVNFYQIEYDSSGLLARWGTIYSMFSHSLQNQARTHTNAWGSVNQPGQYTTDSHSADSFVLDQPSYLAVFSSGDLGQGQGGSTTPPGTGKNVLTVGASTTGISGTAPIGSASMSNSGGTNDGRIKPDLVAPGVEVCSARADEATSIAGTDCSTATSSDGTPLYVTNTGSSMATAVTSGGALIVREYLREELGIVTPDASLIKAMLINGATDLGQTDIPNFIEGWGELNVKQAIDPHEGTTELELLMDTGRGLAPGDALVQLIDVGASKLDITLAWTDPEGSVSATSSAPRLVNNLDLVVTSPSGVVYSGNSFNQGYSIASTTPDSLNNVERVRLLLPESGVWKVEVRSVAGVFQDGYSLVISGDASWVDHSDLTTSADSLRIANDVIFEGEQLLIQTKWRNEGNMATGSYDVEIFDVTDQQSISTASMPSLPSGETETWSVQHAFSSVGSHILELRLDTSSAVIESNDENVGINNNVANLEVLVSKQGLEIVPLDEDGNEVLPSQYEQASSRALDALNETSKTFDFKVKNIGTSEVSVSLISTPVKQLLGNGALRNPSDDWTRSLSDSGPLTLAPSGQANDNVSVSISMVDESAEPLSEETPIYAVPGTFTSRVIVRDTQNPTVVNSMAFNVVVPRIEGIQILASGLDDFRALPGEFATFDMSVLNTGNGPTEYTVDCESSSGWATRIDSVLSPSVSLPELARLEYVTIPIQVLVPAASEGQPVAGHVELVNCETSSPTEDGPSESLSTTLIVEESRRFHTALYDEVKSPLPPVAAAEDRSVLNMIATATTLEVQNLGNTRLEFSVMMSLSDSTWGMDVTLHLGSSNPTQIQSLDGTSSTEVELDGGSSIAIQVNVTPPPTASMGERALLSFRTTEGSQQTVLDSTRFVLEPTPELNIVSIGDIQSLSGELAEVPLTILNSGNVALDLSWTFSTEANSWSAALQSITPAKILPNQELSVMLGITIPDNWPVDVIGKIVTVHIEATSTELTGPSLVESREITVKVIETCSLEVSTQTKVSVDSGGSVVALLDVLNTGNEPSTFSITFSQESDSFALQEKYEYSESVQPGDTVLTQIQLSADTATPAGREIIRAHIAPVGVDCYVVESSWDVPVDILPASDEGITNSLPPYVVPLVFLLAVLAISLGIIALRRSPPASEDSGEELIPQGSALMQGEASKRRMNALSTDAAEETLSTSVSKADRDAVLKESLPSLNLPPLPRIEESEQNSD